MISCQTINCGSSQHQWVTKPLWSSDVTVSLGDNISGMATILVSWTIVLQYFGYYALNLQQYLHNEYPFFMYAGKRLALGNISRVILDNVVILQRKQYIHRVRSIADCALYCVIAYRIPEFINFGRKLLPNHFSIVIFPRRVSVWDFMHLINLCNTPSGPVQ